MPAAGEAAATTVTAVRLVLAVHPTPLAVARLPPSHEVPAWAWGGSFVSVTRTPAELSLVVTDDAVPDGVAVERGWRALRLQGPFAFDLTGVLAGVLVPLASAEVPIFALSTYDTDWVLVPKAHLDEAVAALRAAGHTVT